MARNPRGNLSGSFANNGADDLLRTARDANIIDLRLQEVPLREIAREVGCALSTVQNALKVWMAEHGPAAERVDELREVQGAQVDDLLRKVAPHAMRTLRNDDGEIIYDGTGDDRKPIEVPDVQVIGQVVKLWERKARLYGLDMQAGIGFAPPLTREALAGLWADHDDEPIDVEADELPADDRAAIEPGADTP